MKKRYYLCIDLKSFYASVECVERGLDPMITNLVVADPERSEKTICLAVTPAMKKIGVKNRCRVFEIPCNIDYIMAPPRMSLYIKYSAGIYGIYLKYVSKEDVHCYSIDEVFIDVTEYLPLYKKTAREMAIMIMEDIYSTFKIRATCGIGTNLYLSKVALDITAKKSPDFIGFLDEEKFIETLWRYQPLSDFWRIGQGTAKRLSRIGIYTMEAIAKTSEELLYRTFGMDAELLIDHAWGREPVTISDIKEYKPKTRCITSGQVLKEDYSFYDGEIIIKEMMDELCMQLVEKGLVTKSVTLHIGYSNKLCIDPAHGTFSVERETNAANVLIKEAARLYREIVNPMYCIRRVHMYCNNVVSEDIRQISFFDNNEKNEKNTAITKTMVGIKRKFGKNSVFKGMDLYKNATARERNLQIGGHKSGEE